MGSTAYIIEVCPMNNYIFSDEVTLVRDVIKKTGMQWDIPEGILQKVYSSQNLDSVHANAVGDEYLDEYGETWLEALDVELYNLNNCQHYDMHKDDSFPYHFVDGAASLFKSPFIIEAIQWSYDKAFRLILNYLKAKQDKLAMVWFEGGHNIYLSYEDCLTIYNYCDGDNQKIDHQMWFGEGWQEMSKLKKAVNAEDLKQWI